MYMPPHFRVEERPVVASLIARSPLATVIVVEGGTPLVNHVPLLLDGDKLIGHVSRHNELWEAIGRSGEAMAVFQGPQAYVSPSWYAEHDVPTWNYAVVHVSGPARLVEDPKGLVRILARMTDVFEAGMPKPWQFGIPDDLAGEGVLAKAIVGFEIDLRDVSCKLKLGQNRSVADRSGAIAGLQQLGGDANFAVARMMKI